VFKGLKIALLIGLAFVASAMLALYFDGRRITFDSVLQRIESSTENALVSVKAKTESLINNQAGTVFDTALLPSDDGGGDCIDSSAQWRPMSAGGSCRDWSLGEVTPKLVQGIYTWQDKDGTPNFSNVKPRNTITTQHDFRGLTSVDYFTLAVSGDPLPKHFSDRLRGRINRVFSFYSGLISHQNLNKTALKLRFFNSHDEFLKYRKLNNSAAKDNAVGFYSGANNQSSILYRNATHAMEVAVHESSHAINRSVMGLTKRWLNEGLAEYLEGVEVVLQLGTLKPSRNWSSGNTRLLPLSKVFSATSNDWSGTLRSTLYQTSSAFIFYMMDDQQRKQRFSRYIKAEQANLCNVLSSKQLLRYLGVSQSQLQRDFSRWLNLAEYQEHLI